jgi:hypothetical protein
MIEIAEHEPPEVEARAERSGGQWFLFIVCPFCGKKHMHGGGKGDEPFYGYRVSECLIEGGSYNLIPEIEE